MAKEVRSWSKPDGIPNIIGIKKVDWSVFEYGTHIPLEFIEDFDKANKDNHINRGESHAVKFLIDGETYDTSLVNLNREGVLVDTLQLRYDNNQQLKELLKNRFSSTYNYILNERTKRDEASREHIKVDDEYAEYLEFYETDNPYTYTVKLISQQATRPYNMQLIPSETAMPEPSKTNSHPSSAEHSDEIRQCLSKVLTGYVETKKNMEFSTANQIGSLFQQMANFLNNTKPVRGRRYLTVRWSIGTGKWADVPWVAFLDNRETSTTQGGIYCVLLFRADMSGLYLTFNQGITEVKKQYSGSKATQMLVERGRNLRKYCNNLVGEGFKLDNYIELRTNQPRPKSYETSTIAHKYYDRNSLPTDEEFVSDLASVLESYDRYLVDKLNESPQSFSYWIFQANPQYYNLAAALSELDRITWLVNQSKNEIRMGDRVFLWEAGENAGIVAFGSVESNPQMMERDSEQAKFDREPEKFEGNKLRVWIAIDSVIEPRIKRQTLMQHPVLKNLGILSFANATNFKIKSEEAEQLLAMINGGQSMVNPHEPEPVINPIYLIEALSAETGLSPDSILRWLKALERKGQVILYGPPGTGKTFVAEKLAKHIISGTDGLCKLIQFHPAYAYEDFMQGIRAISNDGRLEYPMVKGRFLEFCEEASPRKGKCVLIIDELNRANLPRVFGELMYLLEYRDRKIPLSGGGELSIPKNVYLIGTMNTADRSIALVDHALRRRFAFLSLRPNYDILRKYHADNGNTVDGLINTLNQINKQINDPHYEIGVSFFLRKDLKEQLEDIWRMEIEPYLEEYFFDQPDKAKEFRWENIGEKVINR